MVRLHHSFDAAAAMEPADRDRVLGGKGAALARMTEMGLPVPPGFVLTTEACALVSEGGWSADLDRAIDDGLRELERATARRLGSADEPLLVSVRSGAPVSMPGMMDTVLDVGTTDEVTASLASATGDERFAWDTARRFVQSYAGVVAGAPDDLVHRLSVEHLGDDEGRSLTPGGLAEATRRLRAALAMEGFVTPDEPRRQVTESVAAVFASWDSDRARTYRRVEGIDDGLGTAATIQMMTFGNLGRRSGTGVAFTRDPATGERRMVGDFLIGAQGEDVVAGTHSTLPIARLHELWPDVAGQLDHVAALLERDIGDLVDIEFTVEDGKLWLLQMRRGKRSPVAALRIAIDLADDPEFPLTRAEAVASVADILEDPPTVASGSVATDHDVLATGLAASPGRATGRVCVDVDDAIAAGAAGDAVILVRRETSPADVAGMAEAVGIVTTLGGLVSHAAVVARSWGKPAVVGVSEIVVGSGAIEVAGRRVAVGETITIDGDRGTVLLGDRSSEEREPDEVRILRRWRDDLLAADPPGPGAAPASASASGVGADPPDRAACERVLALKGAAAADAVAWVLGCGRDDAAALLAQLEAAGDAQALPGDRFRLLPEALARVDRRYEVEAAALTEVIEPLWSRFHSLDAGFKQIVTAWQVRTVDGDGVSNDHGDAEYDAALVERLRADVHGAIIEVVGTLAAVQARFGRYAVRFEAALDAVSAGDPEMMAHPFRDSYHTIWFELHEELIRASGRTRAAEAEAGRG